MKDIKEYVDRYVLFGRPIPCHGVNIQPVKWSDVYLFNDAIKVFRIDKNRIPDIEIIQQTYLRFLLTLICSDEEDKERFLTILSLCLGAKYNAKERNNEFEPNEVLVKHLPKEEQIFFINGWNVYFHLFKTKCLLCIEYESGEVRLSDEQFDDIMKIILFQNVFNYDDREMSEDFRRVVEDYYKLKNKDIIMPSPENKAMAVVTNSSYTLKELEEVPLRLVESMFDCIIDKTEYELDKLIVNQPNIEVKGFDLNHWIYKKKVDKYSEIFTDAQNLINKVTSI